MAKKFTNWAPPGVMREYFTASDFEPKRPDGRFEETLGFVMAALRDAKPKLGLETVKDAADFPEWRNKVRAKLRELLNLRSDLHVEFKLLSDEPREGYRLQKYEFYPEKYLAVPIYVLIPDEVIEKNLRVPAVICHPGGGGSLSSLAGEPDTYINRFPFRNRQAWWYCKAGMIGIAIENPATGENSGGEVEYGQVWCKVNSLLSRLGRTYVGLVTEQTLMIVDFLKRHANVDNTRIAVSGLSLGCYGVLYPALMSDDIAAAVYNDFVCSGIQRIISTTEIPAGPSLHSSEPPGMLEWFDVQPDLQSALAPLPLLLAEGGPWRGHIEKIVKAYEMSGKPENLSVCYYEKYADPAARVHDHQLMREQRGLKPRDYLEFANVDDSQHSFHPEVDVPWLLEVFGMPPVGPEMEALFDESRKQKEILLYE